MAVELEKVKEDADLVKKELMLETAENEWLEDWGSWFGVSRLIGETDDHLRYRILSCMEDKVSIPSIQNGIAKILNLDNIRKDDNSNAILGEDPNTGKTITISVYEPFEDVRIFNVSTFSGKGRYEDKYYYRIGVIDLKIDGLDEVTEEVRDYIKTLNSAGIYLYVHINGELYTP